MPTKVGTYEGAIGLLAIASQAIVLATQLRDNGAQSEEWTTEQEDAFDAKVADAKAGKPVQWSIEPDPTS